MQSYKKSIIALGVLIFIGLLVVLFTRVFPGKKIVSPTQSIGEPPKNTSVNTVSLYSMIPCQQAVGITLDPQSGALVSKQTTKFAEYDIGLVDGGQVPEPVAKTVADTISSGLCAFEKNYNDNAFGQEDLELLRFVDENGKPTDMKYSYFVSMKQIPVVRWGILSLPIESYEFTGGAHGMGVVSNILFDTKNNIALKGRDFFKPELVDQLRDLVKKKLQITLGDMSDHEMLDAGIHDDTVLFDVIIPTDTGLTFKFQSYAVAPYAAGQPEAAITFTELAPFLTQEWNDRLGL